LPPAPARAKRLFVRILLPAVAALVLVGCSDPPTVHCGPGTFQFEDVCLPVDASIDSTAIDTREDVTGEVPTEVGAEADASLETGGDADALADALDTDAFDAEDGATDAPDSAAEAADVGPDSTAETLDAASDSADADTFEAPPGCTTASVLSSSKVPLIEAFPLETGILVVQQDQVRLISRDGSPLKAVAWPRLITAAALDSGRLIVVDKAAFRVVSTVDFSTISETFTADTCTLAAVTSKSRLVCLTSSASETPLLTYDLKTGVLLAKSKLYTSAQTLRPVPGTDELVAAYYANLVLYSVTSAGYVTTVGTAGVSDFYGTIAVLAFHTPTDHLVTPNGALHQLHAPTCFPGAGGGGCLPKDGVLGTLATGERFVGLTDDGANTVYGLVEKSGGYYCETGCTLQQIDGTKRVVVSQKTHTISSMRMITSFRRDPVCNTILVGHQRQEPGTLEYSYRLTALDY